MESSSHINIALIAYKLENGKFRIIPTLNGHYINMDMSRIVDIYSSEGDRPVSYATDFDRIIDDNGALRCKPQWIRTEGTDEKEPIPDGYIYDKIKSPLAKCSSSCPHKKVCDNLTYNNPEICDDHLLCLKSIHLRDRASASEIIRPPNDMITVQWDPCRKIFIFSGFSLGHKRISQSLKLSLREVMHVTNAVNRGFLTEMVRNSQPIIQFSGGKQTDLDVEHFFESRAAPAGRKITLAKPTDEAVKCTVPDSPITNKEAQMRATNSNEINKKHGKKVIPKILKAEIWKKYIGNTVESVCYCCNIQTISNTSFHAGHIISEVMGGDISLQNLRPICQSCNSSMGTQNMRIFAKFYPDSKINNEICYE